jgi:nitrite reductase/ring-hydroxylating ferredoxin subunit
MGPSKGAKLKKIEGARDLKEGKSLKFFLKREDRETEAFLIRRGGKFFAYLNLCRHWTVGLDFDDNEFFSEDGEWLVCKNHGAIYHPVTGTCESGPCGGASLYGVPLVEKDGEIFADLGKMEWGEV